MVVVVVVVVVGIVVVGVVVVGVVVVGGVVLGAVVVGMIFVVFRVVATVVKPGQMVQFLYPHYHLHERHCL